MSRDTTLTRPDLDLLDGMAQKLSDAIGVHLGPLR
jgi:hypothetical protein